MKLRPGDDQWTHLLSSSIFTFFFCMCSSFSIFLTTYNTSFFFFFPFSLRSPLCGTTLDFFCHLIIIIYSLAGYGASPAICHRDGDKFVKAEKGGCVRAVPRASCLRGKRRALCGVLVLGVLCCCGGRLSEKGGGTETRGEAYMLKGAPLPHLKNTGCHVPLVFIDQKRKVKFRVTAKNQTNFWAWGGLCLSR